MFSFAPTNAFLPVIDRYIYLVTYINYNGVMLYKIAINNTLHIPFLRKYFGFLFFNALPLPPRFFRGGGKTSSGGGKVSGGGALPHLPPPFVRHCIYIYRVHQINSALS